MNSITLKYGLNPQQAEARIYAKGDQALPLQVLNGRPGYINFMDALNGWQLVKDLRQSLDLPAAASFKHVSPAGAAVGVPLSPSLERAYFVDDMELSPLATAYARARGADRVSSFGDWVALSDVVDESTAKVIQREVSDGVIAPGYTQEALAILQGKKQGSYNVIEVDPDYSYEGLEAREIFGIVLEQSAHAEIPSVDDLNDMVTANRDLSESAKRDLVLAMITLKYTQSNSVCYALDGQVVGAGAGQQSRIHCTRLAGDKADIWRLRQHPNVLDLPFKKGIRRAERDNGIDLYLRDDLTDHEQHAWEDLFVSVPTRLTPDMKREWLGSLQNVALASDAFFPFRDNIDRAHRSGVSYVVQPGGSVADEQVIEACNEYGMAMAFSHRRLFHH